SLVWSPRRDRETLAALELFPISLRTGGQGATHLVSHRRGPSGAGALGAGGQRFHLVDGSPCHVLEGRDACRWDSRFVAGNRYSFVAAAGRKRRGVCGGW